MSTQVQQASEWRTAVAAATGVEVFAYDDKPADNELPDRYVLVHLDRRAGESERACGGIAMRGWRLATRYVGRTLDEVRWLSDRMATLERTRQSVIGSTPLTFESSDPPEERTGRWEAADVWTYSAPI